MAQLNIKPAAGQKLQLQRHTGADAIVIDTHGNVQLGGTLTTGTITNAVAVPQEPIKKFHHFTHATKITPNNSRGVKFTWTTAFTPLDPENNQLHIHAACPAASAGNDSVGYGLQFEMTSANAIIKGYAPVTLWYDFFGKGVQYADAKSANKQVMQQYNFVIGAGELAVGTYSIHHSTEQSDSQVQDHNPNSADDNRLTVQTQSELMIIEYKNI